MYLAMLDKKNFGKFRQTQKCLGPQYVDMRGEINGQSQVDDNVNMQIDSTNANADSKLQEDIVVMYFGAGRGPLIRRALNAARRAGVYDNVKVVALDKNPNAIITLRNMLVDEQLEDKVTLFSGDMRKLEVKDL